MYDNDYMYICIHGLQAINRNACLSTLVSCYDVSTLVPIHFPSFTSFNHGTSTGATCSRTYCTKLSTPVNDPS